MITNKREIDATEFNLLAHTELMSSMIVNRVQIPASEIDDVGLGTIRNMLEESAIGMFHIRSTGFDTFVYFTKFADQQLFVSNMRQYFSNSK